MGPFEISIYAGCPASPFPKAFLAIILSHFHHRIGQVGKFIENGCLRRCDGPKRAHRIAARYMARPPQVFAGFGALFVPSFLNAPKSGGPAFVPSFLLKGRHGTE